MQGVIKEIDSPETRARLDEMARQRKTMFEDANRIEELMKSSSIPENDRVLYFDRAKLFGEKVANDWMLGKYPNH